MMKPDPLGPIFAASAQALSAAGTVEYHLSLAGQRVRLLFAGPALLPVTLPALRHLLCPPSSPPDLTITLWDSASTGLSLPDLPAGLSHGEAWKLEEPDRLAFYLPARASLACLDRASSRACCWFEDASSTPGVEICDPLLYLWSWWFETRSAALLHAAALAGKTGAALLVGPGGSGKSTTALLALNSPLRYLADDYCLVTARPAPVVHSLFASAKLLLADRPRFPWLEPAHAADNSEKALYILHPALSDHLSVSAPLTAFILPSITGQAPSRLVPARPMEILRALAPSTLFQLRVGTDPARSLRLLSELAQSLPCYRLLLGPDFERIPAVLAGLLDG